MKERAYNYITLSDILEYTDDQGISRVFLSNNQKFRSFFSLEHPFIFEGVAYGLCTRGSAKLKINSMEYQIVPNSIVVIFPNRIYSVWDETEDFLWEMLFISNDFIYQLPPSEDHGIVASIMQQPYIVVSQNTMDQLMDFYYLTLKYYEKPREVCRGRLVASLIYGFIIDIASLYRNNLKEKGEFVFTKQDELANKFFALLLKHFKEERSVSFYADKLCLSPKHLSTVISKTTGKPILWWINETVVSDAKYQLRWTSLTVAQISENLHFSNPSFFGRFFKQYVGMTPLEFRASYY